VIVQYELDKTREILFGTNTNQQTLNNALFSACYRNNVKAAEVLIKAGSNINFECNLGTPLTEALEEENFEIAKILLEAGAIPSIPTYSEVSLPLMIAAEKGNLEMVKLLLKAGADINQIHRSTGSFALACAAGHKDIFDYLYPLTDSELQQEALDILPEAIRQKELEKNATPLVRELSDVVFDKNLDGVKKIIQKGVEVNGLDEVGNTALCSAAFGGNLEIVRILLESKADPNLCSDGERTPPLWSAVSGEIAKILIDYGANVNFQDSNGKTDLMITASGWGRLEKFKVLLEAGADTNHVDREGKTALMYACEYKYNLDKVKLLIKFAADINTQDNNRNTALSIAKERKNTKIVNLLIEAGAN